MPMVSDFTDLGYQIITKRQCNLQNLENILHDVSKKDMLEPSVDFTVHQMFG